MIVTLKKSLAAAALSAALLATASYPAWAADASEMPAVSASTASAVSYSLNDTMDVEIKSILNEHTSNTTKLGVVIRMKNKGSQVKRVPTHELRVRTADGVEYTLEPSAINPKSIQPKAEQELSYLSVVETGEDIQLSDLSWVDVDLEVYPKKETVLLTVPIDADMVWKGSDSTSAAPSAVLKWGEAFTLPSLHSDVVFRPIDIHKDVQAAGVTTVVQIEASNPTAERQTVPDFGIEGKTDSNLYSGKRAESSVTLEPGEKKYVHVVIPTEVDTEFSSLNVVTNESFTAAAGAQSYQIGRLNILLPAKASTNGVLPAPKYELGTPVKLDTTNKLIPENVEVALVELHMTPNAEDGYNTAVAKFKLTNKSDRPLPVPAIQTELISQDGYSYNGSRQQQTALTVVPNGTYIVNYAFTLPASETGEGLKLSLYSQQTSGDYTYKSLLAVGQVDLQTDNDPNLLSTYPFQLKVSTWSVSSNFLTSNLTYNYKLKVYLDIRQDQQVLTDEYSSKLQFDAYNKQGVLVATSTRSLVGANKLVSGENDVILNGGTVLQEIPLTIKVYESFTTESGTTAKRLLTSFIQ